MRGRKPKPTHLKVIKGTLKQERVNLDEPKVRAARPPAPRHLSERAQTYWKEVSGMLYDMGVLGQVDVSSLEALCCAYTDFREAIETLEREEHYIRSTTPSGGTIIRAHPAFAQKSDADRRLRHWLTEFGMTPSSRSRIKANAEKQQEDDTAERYFA